MAAGNGITDYLESGLKAAGLRRSVIAGNLANLNTPGYRRQAVTFEDRLAKALTSGSQTNLAEIQPNAHRPGTTPVNSEGNDVDLDMEVGEMVRNDIRYKVYVRLLSRHYQSMASAMQTKG